MSKAPGIPSERLEISAAPFEHRVWRHGSVAEAKRLLEAALADLGVTAGCVTGMLSVPKTEISARAASYVRKRLFWFVSERRGVDTFLGVSRL